MQVSELWDDYVRFHRLALETRDVDPVYPVLRRISDAQDWSTGKRVQAVLAHVTYYDLGSALLTLETGDWRKRPMGTERRNLLPDGQLDKHVIATEKEVVFYGGHVRWLMTDLSSTDRQDNWRVVTERLVRVHGNGRWAAYKICEMLAEIADFPLTAPDMGHAHSTGPRQGLNLLYPAARAVRGMRPAAISALDTYSTQLCARLEGEGLPASIAQTETTLCDFHGVVTGRYYVGHDIDLMQKQLLRAGDAGGPLVEAAWRARLAVLPASCLGEVGRRWEGPDRLRKLAYRRTGEILTRD